MKVQSRTYNNGTVIEYIYTIIPESGAPIKQNVFIDVATGLVLFPLPSPLIFDGVNNAFQGVCCTETIVEACEGWITEAEECWVTEAGLGWGL